ncbi:hypothetical protein P3L10_023868 [Capsicum annuum]
MDKEEISNMPHPVSVCSSWMTHQTMSLLLKDESLTFCQLFVENVDIWILEDYEKWLWTKICKINLVFDYQSTPETIYFGHNSYWGVVKNGLSRIMPLHFLDGEPVFYWKQKVVCLSGCFVRRGVPM